jgi:hypothetical protein
VTANSRRATAPRAAALIAAAALAGAAAGCGGAAGHPVATAEAPPQRSFAWLAPAPAPSGWRVQRTPVGATLPSPRSWTALAGDRGSASAALREPTGQYLGYLNLTPRQGAEHAAGWSVFRTAHNRAEGDRDVRLLSVARDVRFRGATGTCVRDSYVTVTRNRFIEVACLVSGAHPSVLVGAAPPAQWHAQAPVIARALASATL